jgi:hypothetical protein
MFEGFIKKNLANLDTNKFYGETFFTYLKKTYWFYQIFLLHHENAKDFD